MCLSKGRCDSQAGIHACDFVSQVFMVLHTDGFRDSLGAWNPFLNRLNIINSHGAMQGKLDLEKSQHILQSYQPRASVQPATLDMTDCPYMWPYCLQPLYAGAQPVIYNATILNGMGVWGILPEAPHWKPSDEGGEHLNVMFTHSDVIWPWSGHLTLFITVKNSASDFSGPANGVVQFRVLSPPKQGSKVC